VKNILVSIHTSPTAYRKGWHYKLVEFDESKGKIEDQVKEWFIDYFQLPVNSFDCYCSGDISVVMQNNDKKMESILNSSKLLQNC